MPTHRTIPFDSGVFSITFTCARWLPLIDIVQGYDLVYKWFDLLKSDRHFILGYVIMPNHLHALIGFQKTVSTINTIVGNGKRFMGYEIVNRLEQLNSTSILHEMKNFVGPEYRSRNKQHQVWEYSFDWKHCRSEEFIKQKLNYYHKNPCAGKWMLAPAPNEYKHSSALFYNTGIQGVYEVIHYMDVADMGW